MGLAVHLYFDIHIDCLICQLVANNIYIMEYLRGMIGGGREGWKVKHE